MPACRQTCAGGPPEQPAAQLTTLRAACASKLKVSSTRPAPSKRLESMATRNVFGSLRGSHAFVRFANSTVRSSTRRSRSAAISRSRNSCNAPCEKGGCLGTQAPQDHLHPQIDDGQLNHLGVGNPQISLHERRHGHHRRRPRRFPRPRGAVHRRQLVLKRVIEQLVPMEPKKPQQLPDAIQALQQELLLPRRRDRRFPTRDGHLHASSGLPDGVGPARIRSHIARFHSYKEVIGPMIQSDRRSRRPCVRWTLSSAVSFGREPLTHPLRRQSGLVRRTIGDMLSCAWPSTGAADRAHRRPSDHSSAPPPPAS